MLGNTQDELMYSESTNTGFDERRHWNLSHLPVHSTSETDLCVVANGKVPGNGLLGLKSLEICESFESEMKLRNNFTPPNRSYFKSEGLFHCRGLYFFFCEKMKEKKKGVRIFHG